MEVTPVVEEPRLAGVTNPLATIQGVENFQMKGAKPGTTLPGEKVGCCDVVSYGLVLHMTQVF